MELFSEADDQQVLDIAGELPTADELEFVAEQRMPIHIGHLPPGIDDLKFLSPILDRIKDLRVYSATIHDVSVIARMTHLQRLLVDEQLNLPPVDVQHLAALQTYWGRLALAPAVLQLPNLREACITIPPNQQLQIDDIALRTLHIGHSPRARSYAGITGGPDLVTLGLSGIRDLTLGHITHFTNLENLYLTRIGTLHDLNLLQRLPQLKTLALTDVRHLDVETLSRLDLQVETLRTLPLSERAALRALPNVNLLD